MWPWDQAEETIASVKRGVAWAANCLPPDADGGGDWTPGKLDLVDTATVSRHRLSDADLDEVVAVDGSGSDVEVFFALGLAHSAARLPCGTSAPEAEVRSAMARTMSW